MSRYKDIDLCTKIIKKEFSSIESSGVSMYKKGRRDGLVLANGILRDDKRIPVSDVVEVKHGEWKLCYEDWRKQIAGDECSVCGFQHFGVSISHYHYCPNCGARMDGGEE